MAHEVVAPERAYLEVERGRLKLATDGFGERIHHAVGPLEADRGGGSLGSLGLSVELFGQASEFALRRASVQHARSIIILSDPLLREQADVKSVVVILAIRRTCSNDNENQTPIVLELLDSEKVSLADHAGREGVEVVCWPSFPHYLLAQAAVTPGLAQIYQHSLSRRKPMKSIA